MFPSPFEGLFDIKYTKGIVDDQFLNAACMQMYKIF